MKKIGRNDPCSCGSGKKYKHCCQRHEKAQVKSAQSNALSISSALQEAVEHHQAGRLNQADAIYQQILQVEPNNSDALHMEGLIAHQAGMNELAVELISKAIKVKPSGPMYSNLGLAFQAQGKPDAAVDSYRKALSMNPDDAEAHNNLGVVLQSQGKPDAAAASYKKACSIKPAYAEAHNNLGVVLLSQGKRDAAVKSYQKAISFKPDYAEAYNNLGFVQNSQGKLDAAVESYQKALSINPEYVEAYCNLGLTYHAQGKLDAAIESNRKALSINPEHIGAHINLAALLTAQGKLDAAIESYHNALSIDPDHVEALGGLAIAFLSDGKVLEAYDASKRLLKIKEIKESKALVAQCLQSIRFGYDYGDAEARSLLIRAISEPWGRPNDLAASGISIIKLDQNIRECIERATKAWPGRLPNEALFGPPGPASVCDPLFQCLLENAQLCNSELEQFLTMVRWAMLNAAEEAVVSDALEEKVLAFYCALARQCFINEYVYFCTDEEHEKAGLLRERLEAALTDSLPISVSLLVTVASYFPLFSLSGYEALLAQSWPESVAALLVQQIQEPLEEQKVRTELPRLTDIEDEVSLQVRQQYEENPYPRWVQSPPGRMARSFDEATRQQFAYASFKPMGKNRNVDILIAGCGSGLQPIESAQSFRGANVLAVDLSLASLSYAKRKTRELGLENIEYAQADILQLGSIDRMFDLIESVGVLHHLSDPVAGWKVLLSLLRPNGFMRLGFYSELARQSVVAARNFIAEKGYSSTSMDIRRCRQDLLIMDDNIQINKLTLFNDFFGTSMCRDLLFHVQEHRFTVPQLKEILEEFSLDFIGFFLRPHVIQRYSERFPDDTTMSNLDYWHLYETKNPDTFIGMYQFLVQKRGSDS